MPSGNQPSGGGQDAAGAGGRGLRPWPLCGRDRTAAWASPCAGSHAGSLAPRLTPYRLPPASPEFRLKRALVQALFRTFSPQRAGGRPWRALADSWRAQLRLLGAHRVGHPHILSLGTPLLTLSPLSGHMHGAAFTAQNSLRPLCSQPWRDLRTLTRASGQAQGPPRLALKSPPDEAHTPRPPAGAGPSGAKAAQMDLCRQLTGCECVVPWDPPPLGIREGSGVQPGCVTHGADSGGLGLT